MSSFLFGTPRRVSITREENFSEFIELEATIQETHVSSASTTDHPVEDGADITDHIRRAPVELSLQAVVSNHPIVYLAQEFALPSVPGGDPRTRAEDAYLWFREAQDLGLLVNVATTLQNYDSMAIIGLSVVRDKGRSNVVELDLSLREIIIATTEQVAAPVVENSSRSAPSNAGKQSTSATSAPVSAQSESILAGLFG